MNFFVKVFFFLNEPTPISGWTSFLLTSLCTVTLYPYRIVLWVESEQVFLAEVGLKFQLNQLVEQNIKSCHTEKKSAISQNRTKFSFTFPNSCRNRSKRTVGTATGTSSKTLRKNFTTFYFNWKCRAVSFFFTTK